jgi:AcrR family transcriptional regulator
VHSAPQKRYYAVPYCASVLHDPGAPPSTLGRVPPGRPRDPAREQAILDAVLDLVAEVGYVALTVDAVAARARTSKATIYRRWQNKHDMVVAAMEHHHRQDPTHLVVDTGSLRGDLLACTRRFAEVVRGYDGRLAVGLIQARSSAPELIDELEARIPSGARLPPSVIERAVERGELPRAVGHELFEEIVGSVLFVRSLRGLPLDAEFVEHVVDDLLLPVLTHAARSATSGGPHARR